MYNSITESKIKNIPSVGDIDINRLPQELTRIYAQIISLRRQLADKTISFQDENLVSSLNLLRKLANNLETIILSFPNHERKESIAFVAATANSLIHKMKLIDGQYEALLEIDNISSYISSTILFLIGNSQADASETALSINDLNSENLIQQRLISCVVSLATGKLSDIANSNFNEEEIIKNSDLEQISLNYLWRELGLGIINIAKILTGKSKEVSQSHFDNVIELSISDPGLFYHRSVFSGPYRLAKLLKILEEDIFKRAVIEIPPPLGVDRLLWQFFLEKLANDRPYLWENHKKSIETNFLNPGISAVITLPTGAGKSTLSELKIASCIYSEKKAIYLVPTHALEDQVNRSLKKLFSEFKPIDIEFDGEYTELVHAEIFPIIVMTPERCLTLLNINPDFFVGVGLIVFDEFHLIHGKGIKKDRRSIDSMYCLLSLFILVPQADYLLTSAMVENGEDVASWIAQVTKRECKLFDSTWKPTRQLHGCLVYNHSKIESLKQMIRADKSKSRTKNPSQSLKNSMSISPECFFSMKNIWETTNDEDYFRVKILEQDINLGIGKNQNNNTWYLTSNRNEVAAKLAINFAELGLKTLVFVDNPKIVSSTAKKISDSIKQRENSYKDYISKNNDLIECLNHELGNIEHSYFYNCNNLGVHHGLLLPIERYLIEGYFKQPEGAIVLVATATLAQGINLPAEIVIIAGDDRYDEGEESREKVSPHELLNAAGRAGRAGLSSQGAVILIPGDIVTIQGTSISTRWWELKNEVFSKGDQCLNIEDPLMYFLDSLQESLEKLSIEQTNVLYRFKPDKLTENDTKKILNNSFYAYKSAKSGHSEHFNNQVERLLNRRNDLDSLAGENAWQKDIGLKMGIEPLIIFELGNAVEQEDFNTLLSKSIIELIDWFFKWLSSNDTIIEKIFTKQNTIEQIKKSVALKAGATTSDIISKIDILSNITKQYVCGVPLNELNKNIPDLGNSSKSPYLTKARNFVNRLIPELSFGFGLLSMVLVEKAKQNGLKKIEVPLDVRVIASCIREGFDSSDKLFFKKDNQLKMRVETHLKFNKKN